jgi:hypothetical protein
MDELERRHIAFLLDDISDDDIWGGSSSTDECSSDENYYILEF